MDEVEDAIARSEEANDQLDLDNLVLEKVIAVREEFIAAVQYLQQVTGAVWGGPDLRSKRVPFSFFL